MINIQLHIQNTKMYNCILLFFVYFTAWTILNDTNFNKKNDL